MLAALRRLLVIALIAGFASGSLVWAARQVSLVPMVLQAETLEHAGPAPDAAHAHDAAAEWAPADGWERRLYSLLTDVLAAIAFALLLVAAMSVLEAGTDWCVGLGWGTAGFVAFVLAPAISLPPELPGAETGALAARQSWWLLTVGLTLVALALARFPPAGLPRWVWYTLALGLFVLPHAVGAPHPEGHAHDAAGELQTRFIAATLAVNALFWLLLGGVTVWLLRRTDSAHS